MFSRDRNLYGMVAGSAGGDRGGLYFGLGLAFAVGSAHLQGVFAGLHLPVVDVLAPDIRVELGG